MPVKRVLFLLALSLLSSIALTLLGSLHIKHVDMADYVATEYGFPYSWLTHTTVTFAGTADIWHCETSNLAIDLVLSFLVGLGFWSIILLLKQGKG